MKTSRIQLLREQSVNAINKLSPERAILVTQFYKSDACRGVSVPVQRAKAFEYILRHKEICISDGELIVGERGPEPKATSTFPEICLHSMEDLEILHNREKVSFQCDANMRKVYEEEIIPFWKGLTQRDRVMEMMTPEWHKAYAAGVFTEFQEQRGPGHTVCGAKIYRQGMLDFKAEIQQSIDALDFYTDTQAFEKKEELKAMLIVAEAIIMYAERHAEALLKLAAIEPNAERKEELLEMARICNRVPAHAPQSFHEALQYYWFIHLGVITELNPWDSFNPGRLDQHLLPFYQKGKEEGSLTEDGARELLQAFWIKFNNHPSPPKIGVTALESNTYTDFSLINVGGVLPDGSDAVNEMSFMILDTVEEMRLLQPSSMVQISKKNPDALLHRALKIIKTGFGQPSLFNTDAIVQELLLQGKDVVDARNGGASGCVESGAFGTEAYMLTGYFNLPKILELTLYNGYDHHTNQQIGLKTGDPEQFTSFDALMDAYSRQLNYFIDIKIKGNNIIEKLYGTFLPVPFLSLLVDDCIKNGKDYNAGGARYNTSYIQGVGLGSVTDMLTSIKMHVYENMDISMSELLSAMDKNYEGYGELRATLVYDTPHYGNDDEYADNQALRVFNIFHDAVNGRPTARGGAFRINMLPTTSHVYFGAVMKASADGRLAQQPLSEGISPFQGADTKGPTAVIKSALTIDHIKTGGTLLNQKFSPSFFQGQESINKLTALIRAYFRMDGHHIQFNVVDAETLLAAQKNPENYRDLIVRVAGYSDYFNDLGVDLQNEIIRRTAHDEI